MIRKVTYITFEDTDRRFIYRFNPIEDTITIEENDDGYIVYYLTPDIDCCDFIDLNTKEMFLVNYHRDLYIQYQDVISKGEVQAYYQGEKIPQEKEYHIFFLSCLVHSGVWLSLARTFECDPGGWDTSHVGLVCVSKKLSRIRKKAAKLAMQFVEEWNAYLHGEVYCLVKERFTKEKRYLDHDSICGFVGYDYALTILEQRKQYLP